jgi:hypothetical protein
MNDIFCPTQSLGKSFCLHARKIFFKRRLCPNDNSLAGGMARTIVLRQIVSRPSLQTAEENMDENSPIEIMDYPLEKIQIGTAGIERGESFIPRGRFPFKAAAFFWDSWRTWHIGVLRHIGFYHKRPEKVNQGEHAAQLLAGFCELLRMVVDTCYCRQPLNPVWSPKAGYYCFDLFHTIREGDRLHMTLHDLASEINPSFVPDRGGCCVCPMARSFGTIIHSGLGDAWGHPMGWHGMAGGNREGLFLVGLFRMALDQAGVAGLSPLERMRLERCYELLMHLFYLTRAEAEKQMTGGVSVGLQQFRHEVERVLDGDSGSAEAFSLLGFGGKRLMKLRNMRDPKILEEIMEQEKILIQQHAETITNDYSRHVQKGFIGDNSGTVNISDSEPGRQEDAPEEAREEETPKKKAAGANPPNRENKKLIRTLLENSEEGFDISGLFFQLQANGAVIPEWVQGKDHVKSYISSFIGALRKDLEPEKKTISKSPYRIIPSDDA